MLLCYSKIHVRKLGNSKIDSNKVAHPAVWQGGLFCWVLLLDVEGGAKLLLAQLLEGLTQCE